MAETGVQFVHAASLAELKSRGYETVQLNGHTVALFYHKETVFAVDNRCPHMGFPLDRGTVKDGILTCHWHHARFDLASGGTFDQWADDVPRFPVEIRGDEVWVNVADQVNPQVHQRERLRGGLERNISLVIAKSVLTLVTDEAGAREPFRTGLSFGTEYRRGGWAQGLTMLVALMNLVPYLDAEEQSRALYHGLSAVARDCAGEPPRFVVRPLPDNTADLATLKRWFRQFVEVRDAEGAERCVVSAIRGGASPEEMADMMFAAVTDHRYISTGHPADFTNKAFEALDLAGWDLAEPVLTSLVAGYAGASRMEESNAWRYPVDLVELLAQAFDKLDQAVAAGATRRENGSEWTGRDELVTVLLQDNPQVTVDRLLAELHAGAPGEAVAAAVAHAAALRIAQFHTSNEFGDWDTALHTFTFANAIHQGLRRSPSTELLRGVFDAAMSIYLDRFLNTPPARLPEPNGSGELAEVLDVLPGLLDRQQQVNPAAQRVAQYLHAGGDHRRLLAEIGKLLLREDRDFHTIQTVEAAFRQYALSDDPTTKAHFLIAAVRYLAAHSPTMRAQGQTYQIALRLDRGEKLFEGS